MIIAAWINRFSIIVIWYIKKWCKKYFFKNICTSETRMAAM